LTGLTWGQKRSGPPDRDRTAAGASGAAAPHRRQETRRRAAARWGNTGEPTQPTARRHDFRWDLHRSEARDALSRSKALGWARRRRWRRAARQGGWRPTASHGERLRRKAGHGSMNGRHRGDPHLHAQHQGASTIAGRRRTRRSNGGGAARVRRRRRLGSSRDWAKRCGRGWRRSLQGQGTRASGLEATHQGARGASSGSDPESDPAQGGG
jgi:hypothetical protein